jgi:hypothetical protein
MNPSNTDWDAVEDDPDYREDAKERDIDYYTNDGAMKSLLNEVILLNNLMII